MLDPSNNNPFYSPMGAQPGQGQPGQPQQPGAAGTNNPFMGPHNMISALMKMRQQPGTPGATMSLAPPNPGPMMPPGMTGAPPGPGSLGGAGTPPPPSMPPPMAGSGTPLPSPEITGSGMPGQPMSGGAPPPVQQPGPIPLKPPGAQAGPDPMMSALMTQPPFGAASSGAMY